MPLLLPTELQFATEYAFSIPDDAFREFQALIRKINHSERCTEKHILETLILYSELLFSFAYSQPIGLLQLHFL